MSIYRIKQFYWALNCKIDEEDIKFIDKYLNSTERKLFRSLAKYEQKHCINVAQSISNAYEYKNKEDEIFIKAALLHDIGKVYKKLNVIEKSLMVMLDSITKGKIKKFDNIDKINVYYNHPDKGYEILKNSGDYDEKFLYLVKNHHNDNIIGDKKLDILKKCDSKN